MCRSCGFEQYRAAARGMFLAAVSGLAALVPLAVAAETDQRLPQVVTVRETFDGRPFQYTVHSVDRKREFLVFRLSYPSPLVTPVPQNNTVPAWYYQPLGIRPDQPPRPAAICLHILNGNYELVELTCSTLASRGIPAIMFKLPYYDERGLPGGREQVVGQVERFVEGLKQAVLDVRRTFDVLASRPEVDRERIGIVGISLGAILGATAAEADPRIARAALILSGGDLRAIIRHAREARQLAEQLDRFSDHQRQTILRAIDEVDPLSHADRLRRRAQAGRVLMINAAEDEVIPRACTEKLASALGISDRVVWLEGLGHYTSMAELPRIMQRTIDFFAQDMPPGVAEPPPPAGPLTAQEVVARFLSQLAAMVARQPRPGHCHIADVEFEAQLEAEETIRGRIRFVRGAGQQFRLDGRLEGVAQATLCQGEYPWMGSGDKIVYAGKVADEFEPEDPFQFADPDYVIKLRAAAGAAAGVALAPTVLDRWIQIEEPDPRAVPRRLRITLKEENRGVVEVELRSDGRTPHRVRFDVAGIQGTATFHGWQTDTVAHRALFQPPAGVPVREVEPRTLYRIFSAMFNFAMESVL